MNIQFRAAIPEDAEIIGALVVKLTTEISERTNAQHFDIDLNSTRQRCRELMSDGLYTCILGFYEDTPVAVATISETYALYAAGKIGVVQEFYVLPEFRSAGLGAMLMEQVQHYGKQKDWSCMELCTPPLPEFERTITFYQAQGLKPVGGRKMRQDLT